MMGKKDLRWMADWEKVKDTLEVWLVNSHTHGALIEDGPSVPFLDLRCVFYTRVFDDVHAAGYIHVKHGLALVWGKTPDELLHQALANMDVEGAKVAPLMEIINAALPEDYRLDHNENEKPAPIYILSNGKSHGYGAAVIVSEDVRKNLCQHFGQDMYILPSSVHELVLVPADGKVPVPELKRMVESVNSSSCVPSSDYLSSSVYLLRADDASVSIAEEGDDQWR